MSFNDIDVNFSENFDLFEYEKSALDSLDKVLFKSGKGSEMLGWVTLPETYDREEYERMKKISEKVKNSQVLIVIGVGGSFLGAKAVIESLKPYFNRNNLEIIFAGNDLSAEYLNSLCEYIKDKDFYINVISKSGSTFETAIAFRFLKSLCEKKYKEESRERIIVTTDSKIGNLRELSNRMNYETFEISNDVGGRFSVLTAVGLFPIMCFGIDTDALLLGATDGLEEFSKKDINNPCIKYASLRNFLFENKKEIEYLVVNEPKLQYLQEWWKQLFAESEGKNGKGLYVESATFTRDLHSFGQMIQDGNKIVFETFLHIDKKTEDLLIPLSNDNFDNLNYLESKSLNAINKLAVQATRIAHTDGGVPTIGIKISKLDAYTIGKLIYFFEMSCAISAYMLGVNPFDQPGVDNYKKKMYELLEKME